MRPKSPHRVAIILLCGLAVSPFANAQIDPCYGEFSAKGSIFSGKTFETTRSFPSLPAGDALLRGAAFLKQDGMALSKVDTALGVVEAVDPKKSKSPIYKLSAQAAADGGSIIRVGFSTNAGVMAGEDDGKKYFCSLMTHIERAATPQMALAVDAAATSAVSASASSSGGGLLGGIVGMVDAVATATGANAHANASGSRSASTNAGLGGSRGAPRFVVTDAARAQVKGIVDRAILNNRKTSALLNESRVMVEDVLAIEACASENNVTQLSRYSAHEAVCRDWNHTAPSQKMKNHDITQCLVVDKLHSFETRNSTHFSFVANYFATDSNESITRDYAFEKREGEWVMTDCGGY